MKKAGFIILTLILIPLINSAPEQEGKIIVNVMTGDCVLDFVEGWNLISFCKNLEDTDLTNVLQPLQYPNGDPMWRYVMVWNQDEQSFELYSPLSSDNPFSDFNDNLSYFIYMWEPATLEIQGTDPSTEPRDLIEGWTTPAYQYSFETLITDMFQGIMNDLRYLMKWNNINQEFELYSPLSSDNPIDRVYPEEGRFIYMWNPQTITY